MALAVAFDTLKIAHHLRKGGITEEHANAITEAIKEASIDSDLATKADVRESEHRLMAEILVIKTDVRELEQTLRTDLRESEQTVQTKLRESEHRLSTRIDHMEAATKVDFARLEAKIDTARAEAKADIATVRAEMREMEQRLTIKLGAMLAVAMGAIAALVKFL